MDIKINDINSSEKEIEATYSYTEIKDELEKEIKKRAKEIQIAGFRKGKAPLSYLKKIYGDALDYEASEKVANAKFWDTAQENQLNPINTPVITDIKFEPGQDLYFKIKFEVMPEIDIQNYTGQEIEIPKVQVRDEDVDYEIKSIVNSNRELQDTDIIGDERNYLLTVNLQRVNENGEAVDAAPPQKLQIDLTNDKIQPEILENSKGKKAGDSFTFTFNDERKIQNAEGVEENISEKFNYKAEILELKKIALPELNEEFIKKVTHDRVSSEEELRKNIQEDIKGYLDNQVEEILRSKLVEKIILNNPFEPPHSMVHRYLDELVKIEEEKAKKQGQKNIKHQELHESMHNIAEVELKWHLLKESLKKKENIEVTDNDLQELAQKEAEKTGITVDKLMNYYNSSGFKNKLLDQKVFEFLKTNNTINYVEPKEKV